MIVLLFQHKDDCMKILDAQKSCKIDRRYYLYYLEISECQHTELCLSCRLNMQVVGSVGMYSNANISRKNFKCLLQQNAAHST